ncbi:MAG TPA: hypothetical protein VJM07_10195 [Gaiella sp.]|nr:hypothetical protein [Gaiella sp.]
MGVDAASEHLAHAAELERRDEEVASELATIRELGDAAGAIRARAAEIRESLERIPAELGEIGDRRRGTEAEAARARGELQTAEARVVELEAKRRKADELDRARREAATARDRLEDAEAQLGRLEALEPELRARARALRQEGDELARSAARVAAEIRSLVRVTESAGDDPGAALDEVEEWGARVRSALFVARGTLETERERIVIEANALGTAVLGESLGASSVHVVRRRLEAELGG